MECQKVKEWFRTPRGAFWVALALSESPRSERTMHNRNLRAITGKRIPCWGCWLACPQTRTHFHGIAKPAVSQSLSQWRRGASSFSLIASPAAIPLKMLKMTLGAARFGLWRARVSRLYWPWPFRKYARAPRCRTLRGAPIMANRPGNHRSFMTSFISHPVLNMHLMQLMLTTYLVRRDLCEHVVGSFSANDVWELFCITCSVQFNQISTRRSRAFRSNYLLANWLWSCRQEVMHWVLKLNIIHLFANFIVYN